MTKIEELLKERLNTNIDDDIISTFVSDFYSQMGSSIEYIYRDREEILNILEYYFRIEYKELLREENINKLL
jgi:hypothetical protein